MDKQIKTRNPIEKTNPKKRRDLLDNFSIFSDKKSFAKFPIKTKKAIIVPVNKLIAIASLVVFNTTDYLIRTFF